MYKIRIQLKELSTILMLPVDTVEVILNSVYVDHQVTVGGIKAAIASLRRSHATSNNQAAN